MLSRSTGEKTETHREPVTCPTSQSYKVTKKRSESYLFYSETPSFFFFFFFSLAILLPHLQAGPTGNRRCQKVETWHTEQSSACFLLLDVAATGKLGLTETFIELCIT